MVVRVVTDSTADLPPDLARQMGVTVVPLNIHFGEQGFLDGVTISSDQFYERLLSSPKLPTTSQPSVGTFLQVYQPLLREADGVVSIHISSKLSGTYNAACQAQAELKEQQVEVVDAQQASIGLGLIVLAAAEAAQQGKGMGAVAEEARRAIARTEVYALLDTLEYLEKGGRIGKASAFLGSLLRIKPIITIRDGEAHPFERMRTRAKGLDRLVELARNAAPSRALGVIHSTAPDEARGLCQRLEAYAPSGTPLLTRFGPVLGTYVGPGAIGVAFCRASP